jgi:SAM-dependent methyltransferase
MDDAQIKDLVRARYGGIAAAADASCCAPAASSCCGPETASHDKARRMGYSDAELAAVPEGANLGLSRGNPQAIAALKPGEVVIDLGSGAGFDCFLAARQVGFSGYVIGVDMTHEMLKKARDNAVAIGARNIEFRLGELEHLPVADNTADVILSNCVINLVPDKAQVYREAFRALPWRAACGVGRHQHRAAVGRAAVRSRAALRLRGWGGTGGARRALAGGGRFCRCARHAEAGEPGADQGLGAGSQPRGAYRLGHGRSPQAVSVADEP